MPLGVLSRPPAVQVPRWLLLLYRTTRSLPSRTTLPGPIVASARIMRACLLLFGESMNAAACSGIRCACSTSVSWPPPTLPRATASKISTSSMFSLMSTWPGGKLTTVIRLKRTYPLRAPRPLLKMPLRHRWMIRPTAPPRPPVPSIACASGCHGRW